MTINNQKELGNDQSDSPYVMVCVALQKPFPVEGANVIGEVNFAGSATPKSIEPL